MKKLPHRFTFPLMALIMMPSMLLGMPAIFILQNGSGPLPFMDAWLYTVSQTTPWGLLMAITIGTFARLLVTRVLVEQPQSK